MLAVIASWSEMLIDTGSSLPKERQFDAAVCTCASNKGCKSVRFEIVVLNNGSLNDVVFALIFFELFDGQKM